MSSPLVLDEIEENKAAKYIKKTNQADRVLGWEIPPWLKIIFYPSMIATISLLFSSGIEKYIGDLNTNVVITSLVVICIGLFVEVSLMRLQLNALIVKHHLGQEKSELFKNFSDQ